MLWDIDGTKVDPKSFGPLKEHECLFYYDGPRSFTSYGPSGELFLLHQCDEERGQWSYFVVPVSRITLHWLKSGMIDLRTVLEFKPAWIVTFDGQVVKSAYLLRSLKNAENRLPAPGVNLFEDEKE